MTTRVRDPYLGLKGWMAENEVSQDDIALVLKKRPSTINKKINGTGSDFKLSEVNALVRHFGMPASIFFTIHVPLKEQNNSRLNFA
ncbi:XRE family transcriptional regulator [Oenococcus oeni]|uniref:XRE family transcriptional regulator n=1 Tax=Oenococcus oeni TaxID=1247 RepID=UPI003EE5C5AE